MYRTAAAHKKVERTRSLSSYSSNKQILHQSISNELKKQPPIYITTIPKHININSLSQLYISSNHSPSLTSFDVDEGKLGLAVSHSAVVVSVFLKDGGNGVWERMVGRKENDAFGELVGFGRAVSDLSLSASIFDVMVIPKLRRLGIGRMIVQRILRMLTNKGVYDISALCSDKERLFFEACGFGDDLLGATTMTYTQSASSDDDQKMLAATPLRLPLSS